MPPRRLTRATTSTTLEDNDSDENDLDINIENHLESVLGGVKRMKKEMERMRKDNEELHEKLDQMQPQASSSRRSSNDSKKVRELEKKVKLLEATQKKHRKKIQKLQEQAIKAEADNLKDSVEVEENEIDSVHSMKKLLRKFSDLMSVATLEDDKKEQCPICLDDLELKKTSSLECEHLVCDTCLPKICKGADETVQCPVCRGVSDRDTVEHVHLTERERWDRLTDVAKAWSAMDRHGEETSEEEAEEEFINNETSRSASSAGDKGDSDSETQLDAEENKTEKDEEEEDVEADGEQSSTPPPADPPAESYINSPTNEKRKRMQQLAEDRQRKKGRHR
ncbi:hypothetical protein K435DRAFT_771901 [Dendrothele bispora CBS 962.96]|uniref:RING-type domain-containing protein n=1 Tax=Dendrothele bispora (strain CBS 962.96) TaxID=1314807 RepID=A0A4S8MYL3_DENBC|nr:hypothetical protein K435DRAFT_771901 [Dendrothele bispora CBS 962.96]